uniref:Dynamin family protein n=1 Tax=Tetraselmis sp. GSL018 TaxID=582737 RepID=A0A061S9T3_9CHLO
MGPSVKLRHYRAESLAVLASGIPNQLQLMCEEVYTKGKDTPEAAHFVSKGMAEIISRAGSDVVENEMIEVEITEPNALELDLIDLPGIVGAPHSLYESTRRISKEFLSRSHTLVVCVVSAAQPSLRSSQAMGLVEAMGAHGRSITVMTQIDLVSDFRRKVVSRMAGETSDTQGLNTSLICCVKNRDSRKRTNGAQEDSLIVMDEVEHTWLVERFTKLGVYKSLKSRIGIRALLERINTLMEKHIQETWLKDELQRVHNLALDASNRLEAMGISPELIQPLQAAQEFVKIFRSAISAGSKAEEKVGTQLERLFTDVNGLRNPLQPDGKPFNAAVIFNVSNPFSGQMMVECVSACTEELHRGGSARVYEGS